MKLRYIISLYLFIILLLPVTLSGQVQQRMLRWNYPSEARLRDSLMAVRVPLLPFPEQYRNRQLPTVVNNAWNEYWPQIHEQGPFYTCQQYCGVVYIFDYEINRMRNQPGWLWQNSYPAHYTWNFMNQGDRYTGVTFLQSFNAIRQQGHMTSNDYGPDTAYQVTGWVSGYDKYYRGMPNRLKNVYAIEINSADGIEQMRNYLYDHLDGSATGGIACYTTSSGTLWNMRTLPAGTPEAGISVVTEWQPDPVHGLAIVGYHDSIRYDINHDGKFTRNLDINGDGKVDMRDWETGGFRIANSYGAWWEDTGYIYALYRSFALNYHEGGVWNNRVYVVEADTGYRPQLTMKMTLRHDRRDRIRVLAGVSADTLSQLPQHVIDFPIFNYQGGANSMTGQDTLNGDQPLEFGLDITPLLNFVPSGIPARYFLMVEEHDPFQESSGEMVDASIIRYSTAVSEIQVASGVALANNDITRVSKVVTYHRPEVEIVNTVLPVWQPGQPLQVQLSATGGKPPYEWSLSEACLPNKTSTPEPQISGTSLYANPGVSSFAQVALPFHFPYLGENYDTIYINYSGFISFEPQHLPGPYVTDELALLRMFRLIVPAFSQQYAYQFTDGDGIWFQADATRAIIRWKVSVAPNTTSTVNDFALILYPDGRFEFCYGTMTQIDSENTVFSGYSNGGGGEDDLHAVYNGSALAGTSMLYYPPVLPPGITLSRSGLLEITDADPDRIYSIGVKASDANRLEGSRHLMLTSGLLITEELLSGDDHRLKPGQNASFKLNLTNMTTGPLQNISLALHCSDTILLVSDSLKSVALINPGETVTISSAFSFKPILEAKNGYQVMMRLKAETGNRTWNKDLRMPVAAPEINIGPPLIADGYNGRLDPGEVAELVADLSNTGSLDAQNLEIALSSGNPSVTVLSNPVITTDRLGVSRIMTVRYLVKAVREILPGSNVNMQINIVDGQGTITDRDFSIIVGARPVGIINLSQSNTTSKAMARALDSLHVGYDTLNVLPGELIRYASVFLSLGTRTPGTHILNPEESARLSGYLDRKGNLYMESYYAWYYQNEPQLMPRFGHTSKKIPAYYYPEAIGVPGTFAADMNFTYLSPLDYAVFSFEPATPAFSVFDNGASTPRALVIANPADGYKTIGSMLGFGEMYGTAPPSGQVTLMQRYLEFFDLNVTGPFPLFHAASTTVCKGSQVSFTDDSFDNITSRSWEFTGGEPATSTEVNPVVTYPANGVYDVKLTVSDGHHTRSILKQQYVTVASCTGQPEMMANTPFRIYPNPATDLINLVTDLKIHGSVKLEFLDVMGRKQMERIMTVVPGTVMVMGIGELPTGIFLLRIIHDGNISYLRFIRK